MSKITLYGIRDTRTGYFLPIPLGRAGRGGSHLEPVRYDGTKNTVPRLFHNEAHAKNCLSTWLRGKVVAYRMGDGDGYYEEDIEEIPQPHRKRENMEIVPVEVIIP